MLSFTWELSPYIVGEPGWEDIGEEIYLRSVDLPFPISRLDEDVQFPI
jgi:hypothetical protein